MLGNKQMLATKTRFHLIVFSLLLLAIFAFSSSTVCAETNDVALKTMLREVKVALLRVEQTADQESLPPLKQATLELKATQTTDANGKISFFVASLGGGVKSQAVQTITLILAPPDKDSGEDVASVQIADILAEAILAGARAIDDASRGEPPLIAKDLSVTVQFGLTTDGEGGLSLAFPPFDGEIGGKYSAATVQKITVHYKVE